MMHTRRHFINSTLGLGTFLIPNRAFAQGWEAAAIWVGSQLLSGAISHVGGLALSAALGETQITDVKTWIREAVVELEAFFVAKIDENAIELLASDISGIQTNLRTYSALQPGRRRENRYLIDNADIHTASLIERAYNYPQSQELWYAGIAYRFFEIWAHYLLDSDRGHISAERPFVDRFLNVSLKVYNQTLSSLDPNKRIVLVCDANLGDPGNEIAGQAPLPGYYYCDVSLDGRFLQRFMHDTDANSARSQADAYANTIKKSAFELFDGYKTKVGRALHATAACYNLMCKKSGLPPFAPPPGVIADLTPALLRDLSSRSLTVVPGAVIGGNNAIGIK